MQQLRRAGAIWVGGAIITAGLVLPAVAHADAVPDSSSAATESTTDYEHDHELSHDSSIVTAADGVTFARDEWVPPAPHEVADAAEDTVASDPIPSAEADTTDVFALNSLPGALRTIYLDFDGGSLLSSNSWLGQGLSGLSYPAWSLDSSPSFSAAERTAIREIWQRVAEDFAPFAINVTTQEPASGALWRSSTSDQSYGTRVAFAGGVGVQSSLCSAACGGVAWIGTFDMVTFGEVRSPAWVFPNALGNKAKSMAEAASHEAGHTLGLNHDGTLTSAYYSGNSLWGPIMGSPYSAAVTQWSRGSYRNANNKEDDLAVMQANGAPLRPDESGSTPGTALPLLSLPNATGYITSPSDSDWYGVTDCTGAVTASAVPASVGANLDIALQIRDSDGTALASAAPTTTRTDAGLVGMGAALSTTLTGGPYYVSVAGSGSGASWSAGGYDAWGSLGAYRIVVSGCDGVVALPPGFNTGVTGGGTTVVSPRQTRPRTPSRPRVKAGKRGGKRSAVVTWTAPSTGGTAITGYQLRAYKLNSRGKIVAKGSTKVFSARTRKVDLRLGKGRWVIKVKARNRIGWSSWSARSARVTPR